MKISFCQTYGNDRKQLLEIKFRDKKLHQLLKFFDINIFSFHNCSNELIDWFKQNNNIPNLKIFINNNVNYTQCIKRLLDTINTLKCNLFFFHQDDTFSFDNDNVEIEDLLHFLFLEKDIMLNLMFQNDEFENLKIYKHLKTINIFENSSQNFAKHKKWAFDDSPYICTTNYLPIIYDNNYLQYTDIWSAEHYLNYKFQQIDIKRFVTNKSLFKNYNFLGPNNWNHEYEIKTLIQKQLILT
jgi:hypothetical protein